MSQRFETLTNWLKQLYPNQPLSLKKLRGDASFRHYYRLHVAEKQFVVMDAPPHQVALSPFIQATIHFEKAGIRVPRIHHQNMQLGALVLEDFGNTHYADALDDHWSYELQQHAIDNIFWLQQYEPEVALPVFDAKEMRFEFSLFQQWYLQHHCQIEHADLDVVLEFLITTCQEQPYVTIHRDFHSRNLMVLAEEGLGVLDHQDHMHGPVMYDLVSLLRDCYIEWPTAQVDHWLRYFIEHKGLPRADALRWFDITGVQRHTKAIGIFARLAHLYGNNDYLKHIPLTLRYILSIATRTPELYQLKRLIEGLL